MTGESNLVSHRPRQRRGSRWLAVAVLVLQGAAPTHAEQVFAGPETTVATGVGLAGPDVALAPGSAQALVVWSDGSIRGALLAGEELSSVNPLPAISSRPGDHDWARVAVDGDGRFAVAWQGGYVTFPVPGGPSPGGDGSGSGVYLRRLRPDGAPRGGEIRVHRDVTGDQSQPRIAAAADGSLVVAWEERAYPASIRFAAFGADGRRLGKARRLRARGSDVNLLAGLAAGADFFTAGWTEAGERRFGCPPLTGAVERVRWDGSQIGAVARFADGNVHTCDTPMMLGVLGSSHGPLALLEGNNYNYARFTPEGAPPARRVVFSALRPCNPEGCQDVEAVAGDDRGRFVVIWENERGNADGSSDHELTAELYGRDGKRRVASFPVSSSASPSLELPAAAFGADGTLVVVWQRGPYGGPYEIVARRFVLR